MQEAERLGILKNLLRNYVEANEEVDKISRCINNLAVELNSDNEFRFGVPYRVSQTTDNLLRFYLNEEKFEWLQWWMYDTVSYMDNERHAFVSDKTGAGDLETFDEFFDFVWGEIPLNVIFDRRK